MTVSLPGFLNPQYSPLRHGRLYSSPSRLSLQVNFDLPLVINTTLDVTPPSNLIPCSVFYTAVKVSDDWGRRIAPRTSENKWVGREGCMAVVS